MGKKKKNNDKLIPKRLCADQLIQRLNKIQGYLKWALMLLAVGTVTSPILFWGVIPAIIGLALIGVVFKQNQVELAYLISKYKMGM